MDQQTAAAAELAAHVIKQAFLDGCRPVWRDGRSTPIGTATSADRSQAWSFLTAFSGRWAESRELWCSICGADPDVIRQEALRRGPARGAVLRSAQDLPQDEDGEADDNPEPRRA